MFNKIIGGLLCAVIAFSVVAESVRQPNIVFVFADDLGYGDVQCLNPERGKIKTPCIDQLARQGMIFTDAHSGSSVCSPTRYGLLTGRYSWRTRLQRGVTQGYQPNLIAADRPTVASFLKAQGYETAIIGKWHLDFQYRDPNTGELMKRPQGKKLPPIGATIPDGPTTRGFDYFHGFHHARDMKAVIENDQVVEYDPEINMLPRLVRESVEFINMQGQKDAKTPFFLYVPLGSPHTPIVPSPEWQGKSGINDYADFVMQTDAALGAITQALEDCGFSDNTLLIMSSDNGCSKAANFSELNAKGHYPSAHMRGSKADIWDGGHRIPFIVRWPGVVEAGSYSDQLICLTDFFATIADLMASPIPVGSCEDSVSFLPAVKGESIASTRHGVVHHSISGHFAYRMGKWKLCLAKGSGGWTDPKEKDVKVGALKAQLYDLQADPAETINLYETHPEIVSMLLGKLKDDVFQGRSTIGESSENDFEDIILWKSGM